MLIAQDVSKSYPTGRGPLTVLDRVALTLGAGEAATIMGPSGSGKSTLLHILGTLDAPTAGTVTLDGRNPFTLDERGLAAFRNEKVGFVFQDHALLPQCTLLENVLVPTLVGPPGDHQSRARELLHRVGLGDRLDHRPAELSGGERQRAAIARALIRAPRLLLCDEPTGNLDRHSAEVVAALLLELHQAEQNILVVVTHSLELAARFARRLELADGRLHEAGARTLP